jgi:hypothetical protein
MTQDDLPISESFIVADIGNNTTTVTLFDLVEEGYRFIGVAHAPTTKSTPWLNVAHGVQQAITKLSQNTRRALIDNDGWLISPSNDTGMGVDNFAAAVSAGEPMRVIIAGLLNDVSLASARRAFHAVYASEVASFSLVDHANLESQLDVLVQTKPDIIFIVGGTDGGDSKRVVTLVENIAMAMALMAKQDYVMPQVIYAGNSQIREKVTALISPHAPLHVINNVRPQLDREQLGEAIQLVGQLYEEIKVANIPGVEKISKWSAIPIVPTAQAVSTASQYYATLSKGRVYTFDVGSDSVNFVVADRRRALMMVKSKTGLGNSILQLLDDEKVDDVSQWLADIEISKDDVADFIANKSLFPQTIPTSEKEQHIEQAATRQLLREVTSEALEQWGVRSGQMPPANLILLRGSVFSQAPRPGQAILMLLDAVQPTGIFAVSVDKYGVLPAIGTIGPHKPLIAVQTLEGGILHDLGWVIVPVGQVANGQTVLRLRIESPQMGKLEIEVNAGGLEVLPLPIDELATVTVEPVSRKINVGFGAGQSKTLRVKGGALGLVVDARGRPLILPSNEEQRRATMRQWLWDIGG